MKKLENFSKMIQFLQDADESLAKKDDVYRMGVIGYFNLTFELAWKSLKEVLNLYGVDVSKSGSPREILREGFSIGFIADSDIWLDMMIKRNLSIHVYDENIAIELIESIFSKYIPAFIEMRNLLQVKIDSVDQSS